MSGSAQLEFYRGRVAQAQADAEAATLDHVRKRCRRSETAWQSLADRAALAERMRARLALEKAAASS